MEEETDKTTFQALTWSGLSNITLIEIPKPEVIKSEILVKVLASSICGSDLRIYKYGHDRVSSGAIIGHEICGVIEKVGPDNIKFNIGDIIAIGADVPCEDCKYCKIGRPNNCETHTAIGHQIPGGFAEYIHLNSLTANLGPVVKVTGSKDPAIYALAEPLACCINGFYQMGEIIGKTVAIYGAGPIGLMIGSLAKFYGAKRVVVLDINTDRLTFAQTYAYADDVVNITDSSRNLNEEFDIIFTACSSETAQADALKKITKGGRINFFGGLPKSKEQVILNTNIIHYKEIILTGSHGSTPEQHEMAVRLLDDSQINLEPLLTKSFKLKDFNDAYKLAASGDAMKVVFRPNSQGT